MRHRILSNMPSTSRVIQIWSDFYNYQQYGIDFLLSGSSHTVKKVILHSNVVSSVHSDRGFPRLISDSPEPLYFSGTKGVHGRSRGVRRTTRTVSFLLGEDVNILNHLQSSLLANDSSIGFVQVFRLYCEQPTKPSSRSKIYNIS